MGILSCFTGSPPREPAAKTRHDFSIDISEQNGSNAVEGACKPSGQGPSDDNNHGTKPASALIAVLEHASSIGNGTDMVLAPGSLAWYQGPGTIAASSVLLKVLELSPNAADVLGCKNTATYATSLYQLASRHAEGQALVSLLYAASLLSKNVGSASSLPALVTTVTAPWGPALHGCRMQIAVHVGVHQLDSQGRRGRGTTEATPCLMVEHQFLDRPGPSAPVPQPDVPATSVRQSSASVPPVPQQWNASGSASSSQHAAKSRDAAPTGSQSMSQSPYSTTPVSPLVPGTESPTLASLAPGSLNPRLTAQRSGGSGRSSLPAEALWSMLMAAEVPCLVTLLSPQGVVLFQNDLSCEYYGDLVGAAAAWANYNAMQQHAFAHSTRRSPSIDLSMHPGTLRHSSSRGTGVMVMGTPSGLQLGDGTFNQVVAASTARTSASRLGISTAQHTSGRSMHVTSAHEMFALDSDMPSGSLFAARNSSAHGPAMLQHSGPEQGAVLRALLALEETHGEEEPRQRARAWQQGVHDGQQEEQRGSNTVERHLLGDDVPVSADWEDAEEEEGGEEVEEEDEVEGEERSLLEELMEEVLVHGLTWCRVLKVPCSLAHLPQELYPTPPGIAAQPVLRPNSSHQTSINGTSPATALNATQSTLAQMQTMFPAVDPRVFGTGMVEGMPQTMPVLSEANLVGLPSTPNDARSASASQLNLSDLRHIAQARGSGAQQQGSGPVTAHLPVLDMLEAIGCPSGSFTAPMAAAGPQGTGGASSGILHTAHMGHVGSPHAAAARMSSSGLMRRQSSLTRAMVERMMSSSHALHHHRHTLPTASTPPPQPLSTLRPGPSPGPPMSMPTAAPSLQHQCSPGSPTARQETSRTQPLPELPNTLLVPMHTASPVDAGTHAALESQTSFQAREIAREWIAGAAMGSVRPRAASTRHMSAAVYSSGTTSTGALMQQGSADVRGLLGPSMSNELPGVAETNAVLQAWGSKQQSELNNVLGTAPMGAALTGYPGEVSRPQPSSMRNLMSQPNASLSSFTRTSAVLRLSTHKRQSASGQALPGAMSFTAPGTGSGSASPATLPSPAAAAMRAPGGYDVQPRTHSMHQRRVVGSYSVYGSPMGLPPGPGTGMGYTWLSASTARRGSFAMPAGNDHAASGELSVGHSGTAPTSLHNTTTASATLGELPEGVVVTERDSGNRDSGGRESDSSRRILNIWHQQHGSSRGTSAHQQQQLLPSHHPHRSPGSGPSTSTSARAGASSATSQQRSMLPFEALLQANQSVPEGQALNGGSGTLAAASTHSLGSLRLADGALSHTVDAASADVRHLPSSPRAIQAHLRHSMDIHRGLTASGHMAHAPYSGSHTAAMHGASQPQSLGSSGLLRNSGVGIPAQPKSSGGCVSVDGTSGAAFAAVNGGRSLNGAPGLDVGRIALLRKTVAFANSELGDMQHRASSGGGSAGGNSGSIVGFRSDARTDTTDGGASMGAYTTSASGTGIMSARTAGTSRANSLSLLGTGVGMGAAVGPSARNLWRNEPSHPRGSEDGLAMSDARTSDGQRRGAGDEDELPGGPLRARDVPQTGIQEELEGAADGEGTNSTGTPQAATDAREHEVDAAGDGEYDGDLEAAMSEAQSSMPGGSWCWHEVTVKRCIDPVNSGPALLLVQRNVTERAQLENTLSELTEAQLAMLSGIFPRHVIEALSLGNKDDLDMEQVAKLARSHADVTILFMDLVGFTSMSKEVPPEEVITFLNALFGHFDRLVEKHCVQKIDTIGDAYLVASGILAPDEEGFNAVDENHDPADGAARVFAFARDMLRVARLVMMPHNGQPVSIRIGIHTGPCVSGLIGTKLPKWTVLGGTINTAARAEQTCQPDHVQVTEATRRLLGEYARQSLQPTGGVFCKGIGMLDTYLWAPPSEWEEEDDLPSGFFLAEWEEGAEEGGVDGVGGEQYGQWDEEGVEDGEELAHVAVPVYCTTHELGWSGICEEGEEGEEDEEEGEEQLEQDQEEEEVGEGGRSSADGGDEEAYAAAAAVAAAYDSYEGVSSAVVHPGPRSIREADAGLRVFDGLEVLMGQQLAHEQPQQSPHQTTSFEDASSARSSAAATTTARSNTHTQSVGTQRPASSEHVDGERTSASQRGAMLARTASARKAAASLTTIFATSALTQQRQKLVGASSSGSTAATRPRSANPLVSRDVSLGSAGLLGQGSSQSMRSNRHSAEYASPMALSAAMTSGPVGLGSGAEPSGTITSPTPGSMLLSTAVSTHGQGGPSVPLMASGGAARTPPAKGTLGGALRKLLRHTGFGGKAGAATTHDKAHRREGSARSPHGTLTAGDAPAAMHVVAAGRGRGSGEQAAVPAQPCRPSTEAAAVPYGPLLAVPGLRKGGPVQRSMSDIAKHAPHGLSHSDSLPTAVGRSSATRYSTTSGSPPLTSHNSCTPALGSTPPGGTGHGGLMLGLDGRTPSRQGTGSDDPASTHVMRTGSARQRRHSSVMAAAAAASLGDTLSGLAPLITIARNRRRSSAWSHSSDDRESSAALLAAAMQAGGRPFHGHSSAQHHPSSQRPAVDGHASTPTSAHRLAPHSSTSKAPSAAHAAAMVQAVAAVRHLPLSSSATQPAAISAQSNRSSISHELQGSASPLGPQRRKSVTSSSLTVSRERNVVGSPPARVSASVGRKSAPGSPLLRKSMPGSPMPQHRPSVPSVQDVVVGALGSPLRMMDGGRTRGAAAAALGSPSSVLRLTGGGLDGDRSPATRSRVVWQDEVSGGQHAARASAGDASAPNSPLNRVHHLSVQRSMGSSSLSVQKSQGSASLAGTPGSGGRLTAGPVGRLRPGSGRPGASAQAAEQLVAAFGGSSPQTMADELLPGPQGPHLFASSLRSHLQSQLEGMGGAGPVARSRSRRVSLTMDASSEHASGHHTSEPRSDLAPGKAGGKASGAASPGGHLFGALLTMLQVGRNVKGGGLEWAGVERSQASSMTLAGGRASSGSPMADGLGVQRRGKSFSHGRLQGGSGSAARGGEDKRGMTRKSASRNALSSQEIDVAGGSPKSKSSSNGRAARPASQPHTSAVGQDADALLQQQPLRGSSMADRS